MANDEGAERSFETAEFQITFQLFSPEWL